MKKPKSNPCRWLLLICALLCWSVPVAQADDREIKPLQQWRGRIESFLTAPEPARGYLLSQAEMDELWQEWQLPGKSPQVDFKNQIVIVRTCNCSHIFIVPLLSESGDLQVQMTMTKDLREDTAYVMVLIPRQGIRTVDGKPIGD